MPLLVDMGSPEIEDNYQQHQLHSGAELQHLPIAPQQPQYSNEAQFSLEFCDTPPAISRFNNYILSNVTKDSDAGQSGDAFARNALRPYYSGIIPRYSRVSNPPIPTTDTRWTDLLQEIETSEQQPDDPFSGGPSTISATSSFGSESTIQPSHNRMLSDASDVEIVHSTRELGTPSDTEGAVSSQDSDPSHDALGPHQVLVTDAGPDAYFTNHSMNGEQLVFSHVKTPIPSFVAVNKPHSTVNISFDANTKKKNTRKRKRWVRDESELVFNDAGKELARKFREDSSRWWKLVVNTTGHYNDD